MNNPLARALRGAGVNEVEVAARLRVDPKTVQRWMSGRMPYPRHRNALARLTGWSQHDLWPDLPRPTQPDANADEVRIVYPYRSTVPTEAWSRLFAEAKSEIDILAYSALFLAEDFAAVTQLSNKAKTGVRVRIALGREDGLHIVERGREEGIGHGLSARIRTALIGFRPVTDAGADLRLHDTVLYNSIYRADDDMLVNTHIYGRPASHAPVIHLRQSTAGGMASTYLDSFERVWADSCAVNA
ncbi:XRE family transcriptional regulator [Actinoplanes sp. NPDC049596]|uniref:XRE family transcriptional regulator n=1 Tax=unclassified Actinoplanes TaxID=2626549 RepID=UPI003429D88C